MYILVQALLAPKLKPELVTGDVPSLSDLLESEAEATMTDEDDAMGKPSVAAKSNDSAHQEDAKPQWGPDKPLQGNKAFWLSHQIKQMIWLHKYKAYPSIEVAVRSIFLIDTRWKGSLIMLTRFLFARGEWDALLTASPTSGQRWQKTRHGGIT